VILNCILQRGRIHISRESSVLCKDVLSKYCILWLYLPFSKSAQSLRINNADELSYLQASFQRLLKKQCGNRATWEYPFAVAGVNITFMIMQMLDLQSSKH
jgi:hypothetical protein